MRIARSSAERCFCVIRCKNARIEQGHLQLATSENNSQQTDEEPSPRSPYAVCIGKLWSIYGDRLRKKHAFFGFVCP